MSFKIDYLDAILERIIFAKPERKLGDVRKDIIRPGAANFSPMVALLPEMDGPDDDLVFFSPEAVTKPDIIWPLDFSTCKWRDGKMGGTLELYRVTSRPAKFFRGRPCKFYPYMASMDVAFLDTELVSTRSVVGWAGGKWVSAEVGRVVWNGGNPERVSFDNEDRRSIDDTVKMTVSAALTYRYRWSVSFGIDDSPRVRLETDPSGLKVLFKEREREPDMATCE